MRRCRRDVVNPSTAAEMSLANQKLAALVPCVRGINIVPTHKEFSLRPYRDRPRPALPISLKRAAHNITTTARLTAMFLGYHYHMPHNQSSHLTSPRHNHSTPLEPHLKLAQDIDYLPYQSLGRPPARNSQLTQAVKPSTGFPSVTLQWAPAAVPVRSTISPTPIPTLSLRLPLYRRPVCGTGSVHYTTNQNIKRKRTHGGKFHDDSPVSGRLKVSESLP